MKTKNGHYNEEKISKVFWMIEEKLSKEEIPFLIDKLVFAYGVQCKTVDFIASQIK